MSEEAARTYTQKFTDYFNRTVAQEAAKSLGNGAEIEFQITGSDGKLAEIFTFTKADGKNLIRPSGAQSPQVVFVMPPQAAETILADKAEDVGAIGVGILKQVFSADPNNKITFKLKAGFLTLFSKGYFGVVTAGGGSFAAFMASKGLNGIGAIKAALKKVKD